MDMIQIVLRPSFVKVLKKLSEFESQSLYNRTVLIHASNCSIPSSNNSNPETNAEGSEIDELMLHISISGDRITNTLRNIFHHSQFREGQRQIIESVLQRENVIAIIPTGCGKSICFSSLHIY